jgi:hypothetical protein
MSKTLDFKSIDKNRKSLAIRRYIHQVSELRKTTILLTQSKKSKSAFNHITFKTMGL